MGDSYRFDGRDQSTFQRDIKRSAAIQRYLISEWAAELAFRQINLEVIPYASGEQGEFISKPTGEADYILRRIDIPSDIHLAEVKTNPKGIGPKSYCTYKISDLNSVVKQNATIILFCGINTKTDNPESLDLSEATWALIPPDVVSRLLEIYEHKKFGPYCLGNKPAIRVPFEEYHLWWETEKFLMYQ